MSLFPVRLAVLLAALAVFLFALSVLLSAYEEPAARVDARAGPGAYSTSSLGYAGLYDMLRELGWRVERADGADGSGNGLLVLAEPGDADPERLARRFADLPERTLLVLPKWRPIRDPQRSRWIQGVDPLPPARTREVLAPADAQAVILRRPWPDGWRVNELGFAPTGGLFLQQFASDAVAPVVASDAGILVGCLKRRGKTVWILSDPDIMANHGLGDGDNASFMLALFTRMAEGRPDLPVIFDESVHGYGRHSPSPLRLLFDFPLVVVTVLAVLAALLLVLAGAERFGRPERAAPPLGFGKEGLIDGSARLMIYSGHQAAVLRRYVLMHVRRAADILHAPANLGGIELGAWLDRAARARAPELSCADILRRMQALRPGPEELSGLMACADAVHRWQEAALAVRS